MSGKHKKSGSDAHVSKSKDPKSTKAAEESNGINRSSSKHKVIEPTTEVSKRPKKQGGADASAGSDAQDAASKPTKSSGKKSTTPMDPIEAIKYASPEKKSSRRLIAEPPKKDPSSSSDEPPATKKGEGKSKKKHADKNESSSENSAASVDATKAKKAAKVEASTSDRSDDTPPPAKIKKSASTNTASTKQKESGKQAKPKSEPDSDSSSGEEDVDDKPAKPIKKSASSHKVPAASPSDDDGDKTSDSESGGTPDSSIKKGSKAKNSDDESTPESEKEAPKSPTKRSSDKKPDEAGKKPKDDGKKPAVVEEIDTSGSDRHPLENDSDAESSHPKKPEPKPKDKPKEKKAGFFEKLFGKGKKDAHDAKKNDGAKPKDTSRAERKVIYASCVTELPDDLQKKLKKAHMDEAKLNSEFKVLLNILHFLTKDSFRVPDDKDEVRRDRRPYATSEMIAHAKGLMQIPDNIRKYYRSIEFSGKGGFGRVFAAKEISSKRRVAIKRLPHVTEKDKRNNYCEVSFLSTCQHPNIVQYLSAWEVKDEGWIVTEFLEGGTLSEAVKVHQFSERHIAYVAREILKALKYLHAQNYVHRDLKSGNVMMSIEGHIKLIDFGLCCEVQHGTRTQMLGSPYWIPPEMIRRKPHGNPADIWSFAVCVLEMYLKEPPNAASRLTAMFTAAVDGIKDAIPSRASEQARDFLSRCLELNPKRRATAEELLQHPFVTQPKLEEGIRDVLRGVFVSTSLAMSGI